MTEIDHTWTQIGNLLKECYNIVDYKFIKDHFNKLIKEYGYYDFIDNNSHVINFFVEKLNKMTKRERENLNYDAFAKNTITEFRCEYNKYSKISYKGSKRRRIEIKTNAH